MTTEKYFDIGFASVKAYKAFCQFCQFLWLALVNINVYTDFY